MTARLTIVSTGFNGAPAYNTFHGICADDTDIENWVDTVELLWSNLASNLANGTTATFDGVVERYAVSTGQTTSIFTASPWTKTGTWGTNKAPGGTCALLQWRTGTYTNGRELRGRSYISGIGDFGNASGTVGSSELSDMTNAATTYASGSLSAIYSRTNAEEASISSGVCWSQFALMRSRRD